MADLTVANTILQQLGGRRFQVMTGSKNFVGSPNSLSFKVGSNGNGVTHCIVTLTPMDEYNMEFLRIRNTKTGIKRDCVQSYEGVYCDQLEELFTKATGMYTRL